MCWCACAIACIKWKRLSITEKRRFKFAKKTNMINSVESLGYIKCYSWGSPWPVKSIVRKGVSTLISKLSPSIRRILPFLKTPHHPTLLANQSSQVFLINRNATVKLSSISTIHIKQQHNIGFSNFKLMPVNAYINKIHARQSLYISLYCR